MPPTPADAARRAAFDPGSVRPDPRRHRRAATASWPSASSRPRPTSRCRPISAPGSIGAASSTAPSGPTPSARRRSSRRSAGRCRRRASTSSSASPRTICSCSWPRSASPAPLFGTRLLPIGTLYDPFIKRGLDALNYACYQDARFILVATPSGITLAPEGGAHQSIGEPLIGLAQPGLVSFEPAFADELAVLLRWALRICSENDGDSVYLRLSTRPIEQPERPIDPAISQRRSSPAAIGCASRRQDAELAIAYCGAVAPEALAAHRELRRRRSRRRAAGDHLARPPASRLAGRRATAAKSSVAERLLARLRRRRGARHRRRLPSGDLVVARRGRRQPRSCRWGSTVSANRATSPTSIGLPYRRRRDPRRRRARLPPRAALTYPTPGGRISFSPSTSER